MYSVIVQNRDAILKVLEREGKKENAFSKYEWLVQSVRQQPWPTYSDGSSFEGVYTSFWVIQGVGSVFRTEYFKRLKAGCNQTPDIAQLCTDLLPLSSRKKKGSEETIQTLQFSFPSKLCHMVNPRFPIYDSNVRRFYLYQEPPSGPTAYLLMADTRFFAEIKRLLCRAYEMESSDDASAANIP
jgi:hypothetical protein